MLPDNHFGKFISKDTLTSILKNCSLKWSTPRLFNDPFDMQLGFRTEINPLDLIDDCLLEFNEILKRDIPLVNRNPISETINKLLVEIKCGIITPEVATKSFKICITRIAKESPQFVDSFRELVEKQFRQSKSLCLTKNFKNLLMWAHYAENHYGALLGFQQIDSNSPWSMAKQVDYANKFPELFSRDEWVNWLTGQLSLDDQKTINNLTRKIVYTKSKEWAHEEEWRIYSGDGRNEGADFEYIKFHPRELSFVVLGCRFKQEDVNDIITLINKDYPNTTIYKAEKSPNLFQLQFKKLSLENA